MRILKVNDNTVRIFISFNELSDRNITLSDLFQRSGRTEQFFWELITKAREEVDFNLDQPFWIQATVASEEEFVITVIKQEDEVDSEINHIIHATNIEKKNTAKTSDKYKAEEWVYVFEDFEDLLSAVKRLPEMPQSQSSLVEYEDEYYLSLSKIGTARKKKIVEAIMDEFGESLMISDSFLKEHGIVIIEKKAVKTLKKKFNLSNKDSAVS
ncbi:MAG: adaptor protein MecA [Eubacteriales bacterium]